MSGLKQKVIIYGVSHQAQQLSVYLREDGLVDVCAFVVDSAYKKIDELLDLPVYDFESVSDRFPPEEYQIVLSFGYKNMVKNRQEKYNACKELGYTLYTYISKKSDVYSDEIGEGTIIYPHVFLAPFTKIGKGCFIENSVSVAHNTSIGDFCFLAPCAVVCGDNEIGSNCFLGTNSTINNALHVANRTLVAAGAVLSKDTTEGTICFAPRCSLDSETEPETLI